MTATNICSNFGGKWDSPPLNQITNTIPRRNASKSTLNMLFRVSSDAVPQGVQ